MMHKIATIIFAIFMMASCGTTKKAVSTKPADEKASLVISYYQTPGYSPTAPEYTIELYSNRQMYLDGKKNMDKTGKYMRVLSEKEYAQLIQAFLDADFFSFKDEYTAEITDLPTRYLYFSNNGNEKKVRDYYGAPENLKELEFSIQSFLDRVGWEKLSW